MSHRTWSKHESIWKLKRASASNSHLSDSSHRGLTPKLIFGARHVVLDKCAWFSGWVAMRGFRVHEGLFTGPFQVTDAIKKPGTTFLDIQRWIKHVKLAKQLNQICTARLLRLAWRGNPSALTALACQVSVHLLCGMSVQNLPCWTPLSAAKMHTATKRQCDMQCVCGIQR